MPHKKKNTFRIRHFDSISEKVGNHKEEIMNANINTYFERRTATSANDSNYIRRAYLSRARKESFASAVDSALIWYMILALKIVGGIVCAVSFFTILGKIEVGALSPIAGILCTLLVTALECLCFVPIGKRPSGKYYRAR